MRDFKSSALKGAVLAALAGWGWVGFSPHAEAGSGFCPPLANQPVTETSPSGAFNGVVTYSGFDLQNGQCTNNGASGVDPAAFSGAALASQALSELSQSSTQETARSAENSIANRREQEQQSCAAGFSRVNGACERNAAPAAEAAAPEPEPAPAPAPRKSKKAKAKAVAAEEAAPQIAKRKAAARREPEPAAPATQSAYVRRPVVSKDYPPPPVEPAIRYGVWGQVFGEYEKRNANGATGIVGPDFNGGAPVPLNTSVESQSGTVGFQAGADLTSRGLIVANDGVIAGVLVGFLHNNLTLNTNTSGFPGVVGASNSHLAANLSGPTVGVYATYFAGGFSTDLLAKFDILSLNQNFTDNLAFAAPPPGAFLASFSGSGAASVVSSTVAANLNYRFDVTPIFFIQPTVGAQFTALSYGGGAADLGLADGQQVMIQGGAKVGTTSVFSNNILLTTTLTGLAYSDVVVNGGFIPGASFNGNNILANADRGRVRGRGILAFNFDFGQGWTSFVQGDVHGGTGLFGAGGKAGVRYQW